MPCIDGRERHDDAFAGYAVAILCAVIRKHGVAILEDLDYAQLGMKKEAVRGWWYLHEHHDELYNRPLNNILGSR